MKQTSAQKEEQPDEMETGSGETDGGRVEIIAERENGATLMCDSNETIDRVVGLITQLAKPEQAVQINVYRTEEAVQAKIDQLKAMIALMKSAIDEDAEGAASTAAKK